MFWGLDAQSFFNKHTNKKWEDLTTLEKQMFVSEKAFNDAKYRSSFSGKSR